MHNTILRFKANRLFQFIVGITFLFSTSSKSFAQLTDSIAKKDTLVKADTLKVKPGKYHSPKKAAILSAVLPGAGQVYNKKYWKLPIIYVGFAGLTYSFMANQARYVKYRDAYKYRIDNDSTTVDDYRGIYTDDYLVTLFQGYRRYRDLTVIGGVALYLLNVVDAAVDAHLFTFNVSDDLTLHVEPTIIHTAGIRPYRTGIGLSIRF